MPVSSAGIWVLWAAVHLTASSADDLNQAERKAVESALSAYQRGYPASLLETLSPLLAKLDENNVQAIDELFSSQGSPSAGEMIAEARLAMVQQSLVNKLPRPGPRESLLVLRAIDDQVQSILQAKQEHPA